ncbi:MAG: YbgC/FadM family acyl-CoA thioesterase [SAR116 cluster bacterium]|nr:YbgC/FadM family acyl-CoA thioesterase [SAR116 cluster bacterium]
MTPGGLDGWVEDGAHYYLLRVQFEDTDAGGIVYHANYLAFAERARSAYLRCIDIRQDQTMAAGAEDSTMFVVRRLSIDYIRAAGLGAAFKVETRLQSLRGASMTLIQDVINFEYGHILARLLVDIGGVAAGRDGGARPRRMPSAVVERLRAATPPDTAPG